MSVAKSYEKYPIVGDPYEHDKRQYVKIKYPCCRKSSCSKCGGEGFYLKEVRWHDDPIVFDAYQGFGFAGSGEINLIGGDENLANKYFSDEAPRAARYNLLFKWFIPSWLEKPRLPEGLYFVPLKWEDISENGKILNYDQVTLIANSTRNGTEIIEYSYVGSVNDKIEQDFVVIKDIEEKGYYGSSHIYILEDEYSNRYLWKTSARKLEVGEIYHLKGTIKEHTKVEGIPHTVLTRCREG